MGVWTARWGPSGEGGEGAEDNGTSAPRGTSNTNDSDAPPDVALTNQVGLNDPVVGVVPVLQPVNPHTTRPSEQPELLVNLLSQQHPTDSHVSPQRPVNAVTPSSRGHKEDRCSPYSKIESQPLQEPKGMSPDTRPSLSTNGTSTCPTQSPLFKGHHHHHEPSQLHHHHHHHHHHHGLHHHFHHHSDQQQEEQTRVLSKNGGLNGGPPNGTMSRLAPRAGLEETQEEEEEEDEDTRCGLACCCTPSWLQSFANKKVFLFVFCLTLVFQGMYYTYTVSVLTTIEKLFQIKSKTTGIIMSATEMGQIGGALLLSHYGGQGHRPKWIACGMVLFATCSFLCALPHFMFGTSVLEEHALSVTTADPLSSANTCKIPGTLPVPWSRNNETVPGTSSVLADIIEANTSVLTGPPQEEVDIICTDPDTLTRVVLAIFFLSLLGIGIGQTAAYNLGIPYIDDNVANRDSPMYFAVTSGVRILGPTLGFVLGSMCTRLYIEPLHDPGFTPNDPRWIGAWWLGLVIVSVALFLASIAMFAFPRKLPKPIVSSSPALTSSTSSSQQRQVQLQQTRTLPKSTRNPSLREFPKAVRRLLRNEILMLRTASHVFHILPIAGLYTFLPKYLESQFRFTAHSAAIVSGFGGILVMGAGIFASGVYIRRAKPSARFVAAWIALTALVYSMGMVILMFVGCSSDDIAGLTQTDQGKVFEPVCNRTCGNCDDERFYPICATNGYTYASACHAGCTSAKLINETNEMMFWNCECIGKNETASLRLCEPKCTSYVWYLIIFSLFAVIHSTSEVGGMLMTLRCVQPSDKAMALGFISFAIGLFGNVPCPIIYGAVVDSACISWKLTCGEVGACEFYDTDVFRMFFHGMTAGVMMLAFLVDVVVWHKAKVVTFTDEDEREGGSEELGQSKEPSEEGGNAEREGEAECLVQQKEEISRVVCEDIREDIDDDENETRACLEETV